MDHAHADDVIAMDLRSSRRPRPAIVVVAAALVLSACHSQPLPYRDGGAATDGAVDARRDCEASGCLPVALVRGQPSPCGLAVDAQNVYWATSAGDVRAAPIAGGAPVTLASGQRNPCSLAVDGARVYWLNAATSGQVMTVPVAGGAPATLADGLRHPGQLVIRDGVIYWTNQAGGSVMKMPEAGGAPTLLAQQQATPVAIDVDARAVYWTSVGASAIRFLAFDAAASVQTLELDQDAATSIRVKDGIAYWTNGETGDVRKVGVDGGVPVVIGSGASSYGLTLDDHFVYWTDDSSGLVLSAPLAGGPSIVFARDQQLPAEIAVDDQNVYWINATTDGTVMKRAK